MKVMDTVGNHKMAFDDVQQLFTTLAVHSPSPVHSPATPLDTTKDSRTGGGLQSLLADTNVLNDLMSDRSDLRYSYRLREQM